MCGGPWCLTHKFLRHSLLSHRLCLVGWQEESGPAFPAPSRARNGLSRGNLSLLLQSAVQTARAAGVGSRDCLGAQVDGEGSWTGEPGTDFTQSNSVRWIARVLSVGEHGRRLGAEGRDGLRG